MEKKKITYVRKRGSIRKRRIGYLVKFIAMMIIMIAIALLIRDLVSKILHKDIVIPDWVDVQIIDIEGVSRSGEKIGNIKDIVIHYVGNPNTTAQQNRNFFNSADSKVSSHFLVGLDGEIIQSIPLDEKSAASNHRNKDTISIEVCHIDETGKFSETTQESLVRLVAWLCDEYKLKKDNIIRHYDVTGKACPLYFVEHEDAWEAFKKEVNTYRKENKKE